MVKKTVAAAGVIIAALVTAGCDEGTDGLDDAALRTLTSKVGAAAFKDRGHPIEGDLSCETKGSSAYTVTCHGKDTENRPVSLELKTNENEFTGDHPQVKGTIVGMVDGKELFRETCLGDNC